MRLGDCTLLFSGDFSNFLPINGDNTNARYVSLADDARNYSSIYLIASKYMVNGTYVVATITFGYGGNGVSSERLFNVGQTSGYHTVATEIKWLFSDTNHHFYLSLQGATGYASESTFSVLEYKFVDKDRDFKKLSILNMPSGSSYKYSGTLMVYGRK